jgi:hypothetical protein
MRACRCISLTVLAASILTLVLSGCISVRIKMGEQADIAALSKSLTIGESTRLDVVRVIGEPSGTGRSKLPFQPSPVDMWQYYYGEGTINDARQLMLFVYFDENIYQGYLWWSSFDD